MTSIKKVLAICGSTRANSSNVRLIHAISKLTKNDLVLEIFEGITHLPHFNPDQQDALPPAVAEYLQKIKDADGVLICTPEYVFSLPGSLKNALEWTVSSAAFSKKPVALITASGLGEKAYESLHLIMTTLEATIASQLLIQGARAKVNDNEEITDASTLEQVKELIASFVDEMKGKSF